MSTGRSRRIVGNLDCEADFAAAAFPGRPRPGLSRAAAGAAAVAATLLRAFARRDDRLWLPAPVDPNLLAEVPDLPRPRLESGPLAGLDATEELLAWGETAAVAGRRRDPRRADGASTRLEDLPLHDLLWRLPPPPAEVAAAVNDRRFCLDLAAELGCRLPGARTVDSPRQLAAHLAAAGAGTDNWVVKAPYSAAGRWRVVIRRGEAWPQRRLERLFERHGPLVCEPWMERTADFGCAAVITPDGARRVGFHRLRVDAAGRFTGLELSAARRELDAGELELFDRVFEGVATALRGAGYSGPFGIDCWRYRLPGGGEALHPLGEINGRMTFGLVARALIERLWGRQRGRPTRLIFGKQQPGPSAGRGVVSLLRASEPGGREIWLERMTSS